VAKDVLAAVGRISVDFVKREWRSGFVISSEKPLSRGIGECGSCEC
jgi:hypothetical protein